MSHIRIYFPLLSGTGGTGYVEFTVPGKDLADDIFDYLTAHGIRVELTGRDPE